MRCDDAQQGQQGQHEVAVKKHTCSAGETDCLKRKWRLGGKKTERSEGMVATQKTY